LSEEISIKDLVEAGAHFGHQKQRWNPKMKRFIYEVRGGLYIFDLAKTLQQFRQCIEVVKTACEQHKSILFVGTKKQAKTVIRDAAEACGEFYVCERWLGGMLTNLSTIRESIKKLERIEKKLATSSDAFTKKEVASLNKEREKLDRNLSGIRSMRKPPGLLVVVDANNEKLAVQEARKLGIPVMAIVDTNSNPDPIDYVIPSNDDSLKSIKLIIGSLADAIINKKNEMHIAISTENDDDAEKISTLNEAITAKES
jgi:small subunit ribosomal protein S2